MNNNAKYYLLSLFVFALAFVFIFPYFSKAQLIIDDTPGNYQFTFNEKIIIGESAAERERLKIFGDIDVSGSADFGDTVTVSNPTDPGHAATRSWVLGEIDGLDASNWEVDGDDIYNRNTGNVGIGLNTPNTLLHLKSNDFGFIELDRSGGGYDSWIISPSNDFTSYSSKDALRFRYSGTDKFAITSDGDIVSLGGAFFTNNVGIGTATIGSRLTLADHNSEDGGIRFRTAATAVDLWSRASRVLTTAADFEARTFRIGTTEIVNTSRDLVNMNNGSFSSTVTVADPTAAGHAATRSWVLGEIDGLEGDIIQSRWEESGANVYRAAGNVGIGTATIGSRLTLADHTTNTGGIRFRTAATAVDLWSRASRVLTTAADFEARTFRIGTTEIVNTSQDLVNMNKGTFSDSVTVADPTDPGHAVSRSWLDTELDAIDASNWEVDGDDIYNRNTGNVGIGNTTPSEKLDVSGNVKAVAYYYQSDIRLKNNIISLSDSLSKINKLNPVSFTWLGSGELSQGFIAQELEEVLPSLVKTDSISGLKSVQYGNLTAILAAGIKEQQETINKLELEIEILKLQMRDLLNN